MEQKSIKDYIEDESEETNFGTDSIKFWENIQKEVIIQAIDYNLQSLVELIKNNTINLEPYYQRRYRWDIERQSKLIATKIEIIIAYKTPPRYFKAALFRK